MKEIKGHQHVIYNHTEYSESIMEERGKEFYKHMDNRRSVREFSDKSVSRELIENLLLTAGTAPSGAHKQPWTFCAVSSASLKSKIKIAAEAEEKESYESRMSDRWKEDLTPMATDMHKPFLEIAPWLIVVFKRVYELDSEGVKHNNYYVNESVGIACGMLITAIHNAGLVTLTHTPSPMNFLANVLERPKNERAYLLLPVGYPEQEVFVPKLDRKKISDLSVFYE